MSLTVPTAVLDAAERGPIDDAVFLDVIRTSLPYAWDVVAAAAADRTPSRPFGEHEVTVRGRARTAAAGPGRQRDPRRAGAPPRRGAGLPELPPCGRLHPRRRGRCRLPRVREPPRAAPAPVARTAQLLTSRAASPPQIFRRGILATV